MNNEELILLSEKQIKNLLIRSSNNGDFDIIRKIIKLGHKVTDVILIENASYNGYYDIVKILLDNGANPYGNGSTLLLSKARNHINVYNLLNLYIRKNKIKKIIKNLNNE